MPDNQQQQQQAPRSLFQQVQSNLQKMAAPQAAGAGVLGSTEEVRQISQAATGKLAPTGTEGPQRDVQGEMAVVDQVKQGQEAIARDSQLTQLAQQQADQQLQNEAQFQDRKLDEEELNKLDYYHQTQERILMEYSTGQRQLDYQKDKAKMEQLGFSMRLSDAKYMDELQKQANIARLSDAARFQEEMTRTVFAEEMELFQDNLSFRALMAADDRKFNEYLATIDAETALRFAESQGKAAAQTGMWTGIGDMVSGASKFATSDTGSKWLKDFFGSTSTSELIPQSTKSNVSGEYVEELPNQVRT